MVVTGIPSDLAGRRLCYSASAGLGTGYIGMGIWSSSTVQSRVHSGGFIKALFVELQDEHRLLLIVIVSYVLQIVCMSNPIAVCSTI